MNETLSWYIFCIMLISMSFIIFGINDLLANGHWIVTIPVIIALLCRPIAGWGGDGGTGD